MKVLLPLALLALGCGRTHAWRTPVAAGLLATQATMGIVQAVRGKPPAASRDVGPCPAAVPKPPVVEGCLLGKPARHEAKEPCTYYCLDHCAYHLGAKR